MHTATRGLSRMFRAQVRAVAEENGIALAYLGSHWHQPDGRPQGVIVGYSRPSPSSFDDVVDDLAGILRNAVVAADI